MEHTDLAVLDRNKDVVRALYEEAISKGRPGLLRKLIAPDYPGGLAAFEGVIGELRAAFPDIRYTIDDLIAEGDRVAVRWQWTGTHRGAFRGLAASGKELTNGGMAVYTLRDGAITSGSLLTDRLGFLQQIGLVLSDPTAAPRP